MAESGSMGFREVPENFDILWKWKDLTVQTGEHDSFLQDAQFPDSAGGYGYRDSGRVGTPTRNRFIYWRSSKNILELVESSLDLNLTGNSVRFHFHNAPIVGRISIHESHGNVIVLVATVCSTHRLMFPHPNRLQKYDHTYLQSTEHTVPSIFTNASVMRVQDPGNTHCFNTSAQAASHLRTVAAWLTNDGEALFALATTVGSIVLIKMPPYGIQGIVTQYELKASTMMQRLWTGIVPAMIRGGTELGDNTSSLALHPLGQDTYVFAACCDHKIRMWSVKNRDCVMAADLLEYIPDNVDPHKLVLGGRGHVIRKSVASTSQALYLGVFVRFTDRCQFCLLQPVYVEGRHQLKLLSVVFGPQEDLVDFCVSSKHLWSLWTTPDGDTVTRCSALDTARPGIEYWRQVHMEPHEPGELEVPGHLDPRETFTERLFYPGRFSTHAILKALSIFKRSLDTSQMGDTSIPVQALKSEVSAMVEHEIHACASGASISEEELHQLQLQQWSRFYSCVVQYHERGLKSVGMVADNNTGLVAIIKKTSVSYLRPSDTVEHLYLTSAGACLPQDFEGSPILMDSELLLADIVQLCDCLKLLREVLTEEMAYCFEQDLFHTQNPRQLANNVISNLLSDHLCEERLSALHDIELRIQGVQDLGSATETLLQQMDLAQMAEDLMEEGGVDASRQLSVSRLFSSASGIQCVCRCVQQIVQTRLELSRDLLILLTLITRIGEQGNVPVAMTELIQSELMTKTCLLVRACFLLKWCADTVVTPPPASLVESNLQQLEALDLHEALVPITSSRPGDQHITLLELFLRGPGGQKVKDIVAQESFFDDDPCTLWSKALVPIVQATAQILWPFNHSLALIEFLVSNCQYSALQEYLRLTCDWCEENLYTHKFLLGLAYLNCNEPEKAQQCMLDAMQGVSPSRPETFLRQLLPQDVQNPQHLEVIYLLKILGLFEQMKLPALVVSLAQTAIAIADKDDPNVPMLWSNIFKHQLEMSHNNEAYTAMLSNPDASRRKDCLRQFLVVLCERSELETLVKLPYRDSKVVLEDEVVSILESRARSIDLMKHNYYDLLYAFHIFRSNYRKGGSVMYEYGMRLGQEVPGLQGLQKQAKCYLTALNALRLVNPDYAWIVKPLQSTRVSEEAGHAGSKHTVEGWQLASKKKRQIAVLEVADIEKEYMLVRARLQLLQQETDPAHTTGPTPSAEETVGLLVKAGLFDSAGTICQLFDMPLTTVFDGLASRCVNLAENSLHFMQGDNEYTADAWNWLHHNELPPSNSSKEETSADHAWRLLRSYLEKYAEKTTGYHKCVAIKLLAQGFSLPHWFAESYKKLNAPELLRLLLDYDHLEEATELSLEYIDAVMGKGKEYFGLKTYLRCGAPAVWLPYTALDQLLIALKAVQTEPHFTKLYQQLNDKLNIYFDIAQKTSEDKIAACLSKGAMQRSSNWLNTSTMDYK